MKNRIKKLIFILIINFFVISNVLSEEIKFEANTIELVDKDERIIAKKNVKIYNEGETIYADEMDYDKSKQIIKAKGNIIIDNLNENIKIYSEELTYLKNIEKIILTKNVKIKFEDKFLFNTNKVVYDKISDEIIVDSVSSFEDLIGNKISSNNSKYLLKKKLLKMNKVSMIDIDKNEYYFNNAIVNLLSRELIGDDIKINFFKSSFGNVDNDPRLRGNYIYSDQEKSLIKKGVFTTCKIKKDDCPPWQFKSEEILHDKNKKTIYYKNAWLEIYDKPVFYFPKFFHPDPTVKRQSGFLAPRFESSSSLGDSVSVPYYKVISDNKDLTFSPKIYGTNEGLFQNEYRQQNKNSSHILDFSLKKDNNSSKSHFFSRTLANLNLSYFQNSELEFNIETTSDDNYLKSHKIKSSITNNNSLLNSFLLFKGNKEDLYLEAKIEAYEDLTKEKSSDKYQYLLPSFELSKSFKNNLTLISNGYQKNYDTNVYEKVLINDLKYSSVPRINSNGFVNKINVLLKNVTTESENSNEYSESFRSQNFGSLLYDISYPMKKRWK